MSPQLESAHACQQGVAGLRLWVGGVAMVLAAFLASSILSFIRPIFDKLPLGYAAWDRFRWNEAYRFDRWERLSWVALGISALLAGWILFRVKNARDRKGVMLVVRDASVRPPS